MLPPALNRLSTVCLTVLMVVSARAAHSQVFDLEKDRVQMAELKGLARFHTGDDPDGRLGWADPKFDDSSWELLRSDGPWSGQGYKGYSGMAWYRFKVILPPKSPPLALYIPVFLTSYQVFAGGQIIGQRGGLPPDQTPKWGAFRQVFSIPADVTSGGKTLQIAIRVWHWPRNTEFSFGGGPYAPVCIGEVSRMTFYKNLLEESDFASANSASNILLVVNLIAVLGALFLFVLRPSDREYFWFSLFELSNAASAGIRDY